MAQVFLSYSRKDLPFVEQLATDLKNAGFDVWYDLSGIDGGSRWRIEIENALRNSQFAIVVLSPDSVASEWVEREFLFASNLKRRILPLYYRPCELPLNYLDLNYIDVQGNNYRKNFNEILEGLNQPATSSTPQKRTIKSPPEPSPRQPVKRNFVILFAALVLLGLTIVGIFLADPNPFLPATSSPTLTFPPVLPTNTPPSVPVTSTPPFSPALPTDTDSPVSPNDLWITYSSDSSGNLDILAINRVTGEQRDIITDRSHDKVGTWTSTGELLAFESSRVDSNYFQIYMYNIRQGTTRPLTESAKCSNWSPNWSPDGTKIVFYSNCENNQRDIYIINRDGSGRQRLTSSSGEDQYPAFSPDGSSITFTSTRNGKHQIFLMDIDGNNQRMIADGCSSSFSSDGNWLWFSTQCGDSDIKRIGINGGNVSAVGSMFGHNPMLSPGGQFVVFQSNNDIWIMKADGSDSTQLTSGSAEEGSPSWGPQNGWE